MTFHSSTTPLSSSMTCISCGKQSSFDWMEAACFVSVFITPYLLFFTQKPSSHKKKSPYLGFTHDIYLSLGTNTLNHFPISRFLTYLLFHCHKFIPLPPYRLYKGMPRISFFQLFAYSQYVPVRYALHSYPASSILPDRFERW